MNKNITIIYKPNKLSFCKFQSVNLDCFSDEPMDQEKYNNMINGHFWGVFNNKQFIGYSYVIQKQDHLWLSKIGILNKYRHQGLGKKLMDEIIKLSHSLKYHKIILYVEQNNESAIRFYKRYDFVEYEITYQYIIDLRMIDLKTNSNILIAKLISEVDENTIEKYTNKINLIKDSHNPPNNYVIVFIDEYDNCIGYCRLNPNFPGCFPFYIYHPKKYLIYAIRSLNVFLEPKYDILKLTFSDKIIAEECENLGFKLNYKLYKFERKNKVRFLNHN